MEKKHTPGPWTLQGNETPWTCGDARIAIEQGEELGHTEILFSLNNPDDEPLAYLVWEPLANKERCEELRANARLIAAAPEMLEALKAIRDGWEHNLTEPMRLVNEAIDKAEGKE